MKHKSIDTILQKFTKAFPQATLEAFFDEQFKGIQINNQLNILSFNNYTLLPLVISKKIFTSFNKQSIIDILTEKDFLSGMTQLYSNSLQSRIDIIMTIIESNKSKEIMIDDIKLILLHFHFLTNKTNIQDLLKQVDLLYEKEKENNKTMMTREELLHIAKVRTVDVLLLLLFFFNYYCPYDESCIEYYEMIMLKKKKHVIDDGSKKKIEGYERIKSSFSSFTNKGINDKSNQNQSTMSFVEPTKFFYDYIHQNYQNDSFGQTKSFETKDETDSDLDELTSFEDEITEIKSSLIDGNLFSKVRTKFISEAIEVNINNNLALMKCSKTNVNLAKVIEEDMISKACSCKTIINKNQLIKLNNLNPNYDCNSPFQSNSSQLVSFTSQCSFIDTQNNTFEAEVILLGNMIFVFSDETFKKNNRECSDFLKKTLLIKKLFVLGRNKATINNNSNNYAVLLISTIRGITEKYTFTFNQRTIADNFIKIIHQKTNYRRLENDFEYKEILGSGTSGLVKLISNKKTNQLYAVKILAINHQKTDDAQLVYNELDICKLLIKSSESNFVQFYDYYESADYIYIIMEYIRGYSLDVYLSSEPDKFTAYKDHIISQLMLSLQRLQFYGIVHRDLKPENIMILQEQNNSSNKVKIKLIDFGFSKIILNSETMKEALGTIPYTSPEIILNKNYSNKIDLWSFGVILHLFIFGELPFTHEGNEHDTIMDNIIDEQLQLTSLGDSIELDNVIKEIIKKCLEKNSTKRANINDIVELWRSSGRLIE